MVTEYRLRLTDGEKLVRRFRALGARVTHLVLRDTYYNSVGGRFQTSEQVLRVREELEPPGAARVIQGSGGRKRVLFRGPAANARRYLEQKGFAPEVVLTKRPLYLIDFPDGLGLALDRVPGVGWSVEIEAESPAHFRKHLSLLRSLGVRGKPTRSSLLSLYQDSQKRGR